jgi:hypothetical protein
MAALGALALAPCTALAGSWKPSSVPAQSYAPLPAVLAVARTVGIPLNGIDRATRSPPRLHPGDSITALFTIVEGGRRRQWLGAATVVPLTSEERESQPTVESFYSSAGTEFSLASGQAAVVLRMFGPFSNDTVIPGDGRLSWPERDSRLVISEDFLSFGFDRMCETALRLRAMGSQPGLRFATTPFSPETVARERRWESLSGFTREDEAVFAKQAFAMDEFLNLAESTPGLKEMAFEILGWPDLWAAIVHFDFGYSFSYDWKNLALRPGPNGVAYSLPFTLNVFHKREATGEWLVTRPSPPLLTCAGIFGLTARSIQHPSRILIMQVVSARLGDGK